MAKLSLSLSHWCSLQDGIQFGNCQPLASEERQQIDESSVLVGKKLRNIDPQTVSMLCCFAALSQTTRWEAHAAMVSATSMGAFDSVCKLLIESRQNALPHQISPGNIPNTVINSTAGMSAIHYGFDGPNISLCASELSFYEALTKAFALKQRGQAEDIFVSALESWQGLYGQTLDHHRKNIQQEHFPQQCYAALYLFSEQPQAAARILAVSTGRLSQRLLLTDRLASFLFSQGVAETDIGHINLWDAVGHSETLAQQFTKATLTILPAAARVLMAGLGAWQLEDILSRTDGNRFGVQLAIDADGFYGMALIEKASL
ncbi:hypothetical protein LOZ86_08210 [Pectobacterium parvum]|uniref:Beta-ketoacyl synthase N-terminal domain-containing protein n=1 Tax=Pectobacterium parvum TaxID=2778550 RepID=A0AAP9IJ35_9GAMM|nr:MULTISPECIES: hypothetical protein [Pectobacterium]KHS94518.1 hypothetical protein RC88_12300 [Pectobacterium parvum]QHQ26286.1 hypothetical protein GMX10_21330 [Pectobacterium parvum]UFK40796.1 hypothetical protein LOZ86_08210 [Pectobacterium parvum]GKW40892.1 hypothetical protein PEC301879_07510 [Pectobacterium carotovorum subsp. carotovorum]